jgi:hypothetical protein
MNDTIGLVYDDCAAEYFVHRTTGIPAHFTAASASA